MGTTTGIEWTDATVNFWSGCEKVSEGCKYCYMYREKDRWGKDPREVIRAKESGIKTILRSLTKPSRIFTCSFSDFFIDKADEWRAWAWKIIKEHPEHQWQILTKRPERILQCLPKDWGEGYENVWLGVSVENQNNVGRILELQTIPAKIKFISAEPLLGALDLKDKQLLTGIDWVIIGGESGNDTGLYQYRACQLEWISNLVGQCESMGVNVFVKQLGTYLGKKIEGSDRHGRNSEAWGEYIQRKEFPKV